jgi:ABC-type transport system substrate-binding protein
MAIDRDAIVHGLLGGHAAVGRFTATPRHWQYDPSDPETRLPHDLEAAGRLLDEAGWSFRDGSGVRSDEPFAGAGYSDPHRLCRSAVSAHAGRTGFVTAAEAAKGDHP